MRVCITDGGASIPPVWDMPPTSSEIELARQAIQDIAPDMVVVNYTYLCELLKLAPKGCLRAVLTHDARHLRYSDFISKGQIYESSPWTEKEELAALSRAHLVVAIQDAEGDEFRRLAPHAETVVLPCCFPRTPLPAPLRPDRCIFVGSDADHNLQGIQWFLTEIWPGVLAQWPEATLDVCGSVNVRLRTDLPGVALHGRVEDLTSYFATAAVAVVPLVAGSGCKLKLVEALCHGRPCVSTPCGVSGLGKAPGGVVVVDTADAFRDALIGLFASPLTQREMGLVGAGLAASRFDADRHAAALNAVLQRLAAHPGAERA